MELTWSYIISQILVIVNYLLSMSTYQIKSRNQVLFINFLSLVALGISYFLLNAYTGVAMAFIGIIRNLVFFLDNKKYEKSDKIYPKDIVIISFLTLILVIASIFTYNGILSLMTSCATLLYTISIWQKNTMIYRFLGIPVSIAGVTYNIFIFSLFGIIFETITLISAIIGFAKERKCIQLTNTRKSNQYLIIKNI